jgi:hypothetical protein
MTFYLCFKTFSVSYFKGCLHGRPKMLCDAITTLIFQFFKTSVAVLDEGLLYFKIVSVNTALHLRRIIISTIPSVYNVIKLYCPYFTSFCNELGYSSIV